MAQLLLGVTGDLSIQVNGRELYTEQEFPLVELALQSIRWVRRGPRVEDDFEFESMESADAPLIWIRRSGDGWRIGAVHQNYDETSVLSWLNIERALVAYADGLQHELSIVHGINIDAILEPGGL